MDTTYYKRELDFVAVKNNKSLPDLEQVEILLSNKDKNKIIENWRPRVVAKMWDGQSNINSGTPEYIRTSNPWLDVVYVVLIDDQVIYMQTHDPFKEGFVPITLDTVDAISDAHIELIVNEIAHKQILDELISELNLLSN
jgi:hypothetical protein